MVIRQKSQGKKSAVMSGIFGDSAHILISRLFFPPERLFFIFFSFLSVRGIKTPAVC
jgi:hypothetical protein